PEDQAEHRPWAAHHLDDLLADHGVDPDDELEGTHQAAALVSGARSSASGSTGAEGTAERDRSTRALNTSSNVGRSSRTDSTSAPCSDISWTASGVAVPASSTVSWNVR